MVLRERAWLLPILLGVCLLAVLLQPHLGTLRDDAFISFRYALHVADGHGPVFNVGRPPVEGYTNFLWVILGAVVTLLGGEQTVVLPILGALFAAATVVTAGLLARRLSAGRFAGGLAAVMTGCLPSLAFYAVTGLETALYALLHLLALWAAIERRPVRFALLVFLAFLTRPEAGLLGVVGSLWLLAGLRSAPDSEGTGPEAPDRSRVLGGLALLGLLTASYLTWKLSLFGQLVPNTAVAKPPRFDLSVGYVLDAAVLLALCLPLAALGARGDARARFLFGYGVLSLAAVLILGADWMPGLRLFVPSLIPLFVLADRAITSVLPAQLAPRGPALQRAGVALGAGLLLLGSSSRFEAHEALVGVSQDVRTYDQRRRGISRRLDTAGVRSFAAVDIGVTSYLYPNWEVLDLGGLTDVTIARQPGTHLHKRAPAGYVESRCPDAFLITSHIPVARQDDGKHLVLSKYDVENAILETPWFAKNYGRLGSWELLSRYFLHVYLKRPAGPGQPPLTGGCRPTSPRD